MLPIKFHAGGKFVVSSRIENLFELSLKTFSQKKIQKIADITMTITKTRLYSSIWEIW